MKAPFAYYGGKTTLASEIVSLLPEHDHYVEPYAGSLAVLLSKPRAAMETVNDLDGDLVNFWRVLREQPEDLARVSLLTPHSRAEHLLAREECADPLERARRTWVSLSQGRGGTLRTTGWRHYVDPAGSSSSMPDYLAGYVARMAPAAARLVGVSLECRPALEIIESFGRSSAVLMYVDPPYVLTSRNSLGYRHEMDDADHEALAAALVGVQATVVLSGYASPLYEALYSGWHRHELSAWTGQGGDLVSGRRTEVLWSNRPLLRQISIFDGEAAS